MQDEAAHLEAVRHALAELSRAERERITTWAWSGSGLLEAGERRGAQMEAEREVEAAQDKLRKARGALTTAATDEHSWGSH